MRRQGWLGMHHIVARFAGARGAAVALGACSWLVASGASAHGITVDGDAADWSTRLPNHVNLGIVARTSLEQGEMVWSDANEDVRTDLVAAEAGADLQGFAVTADATSLYFRVTLRADAAPVATPVQIQIAIDVDRTSGSGNTPFAGLADTDVAPAAAWERIVQTQGGLSGTVRVRDTAYSTLAMGTLATNPTTNVTEIAIPWTSLPAGMRDALRFTVAIFRENAMGDTADVMGSSDALDVISDYGDPRVTTMPPTNTFVEVMDGVVNHSIDVWFDRTTREVYAPLQIVRLLVDAPIPATEWFEIRNQSPVTLDLTMFAVGDEETPDGTEFMGTFPAGATLASGAVATIAVDASDFVAAYGVAADYVTDVEAGSPPVLTQVASWDGPGANFALTNTGDELLVLGWNRTILDVVTFQLGSYPGITGRGAPGSNRVAVRDPYTRDTDNGMVDFSVTVDDCGVGAGTCTAACRACSRYTCMPDVGASCDDGDMCTAATTCTAMATCGGGTPSCIDAAPMPDAAVEPPDAFVRMDDAAVVEDDAAVIGGDDAGGTDDAGAVLADDAGTTTMDDAGTTTLDAGASDAGAVDAGRLDGGRAGRDAAGTGLPPGSEGCACRAGSRDSGHPYAWLGVWAAIGVVVRRAKRARR